jgi:hypothetical protein
MGRMNFEIAISHQASRLTSRQPLSSAPLRRYGTALPHHTASVNSCTHSPIAVVAGIASCYSITASPLDSANLAI